VSLAVEAKTQPARMFLRTAGSKNDNRMGGAAASHFAVGKVVRWIKHSIDKRIAIKQRLDANPSIVMGDATQIHNALLNIASDADLSSVCMIPSMAC
jgi:hypothetical protein